MYLKEGTGEPWAGQSRLRGKDDFLNQVELLDPAENFGADPLMGSKIFVID